MSKKVLGLELDPECGLVPFVEDEATCKVQGTAILKLDLKVEAFLVAADALENEFPGLNGIAIELLQYGFQIGCHYQESGELDGAAGYRGLVLEKTES